MRRITFLLCTGLIVLGLSGCGGGNAPQPADPFAAIDQAAATMARTQPIAGLGVAIYNRQGAKVFERMYGNFSPNQRVSIASASKLVSGVVLLRLVDQGVLSLDSSTGQLLGWTGAKAGITLRHLLSFTSGLEPEALCTYIVNTTLADCVGQIARSAPLGPPGTRFDYGSTHLAVAGRMAEVATGTPWNTLFAEQLSKPLGLPADLVYYANPVRPAATDNPLLAGGLRMSMNDYEPVLRLVFDKGQRQGVQLVTPALFDAQAVEPFPDVAIGTSPAGNGEFAFRYGLTAWLECATPQTGCSTISSPGVYGFTPWLDRDAGYYAVIGMEVTGRDASTETTNFGVALEQQLKPLIPAALAAL